MHPDTALRLCLFTGALVSQKKAYTHTQQIPPFLRGICGHPFHLRDAPIDRLATECCAVRLPALHDLLGSRPPGLYPGGAHGPGFSALLLRGTPTASTHTKPLVGRAWPAARSRHTLLSVPSAPGGLHPTRMCRRAIWNRQLRESGIRGPIHRTADHIHMPTDGAEKLSSTLPSTRQSQSPTQSRLRSPRVDYSPPQARRPSRFCSCARFHLR